MSDRQLGPRRGSRRGKVGRASTPSRGVRRTISILIGLLALAAAVIIGHLLRQAPGVEMQTPAIGVTPGAADGFNVVLFTLDTLRADRVSCYGNSPVETPELDALAANGVRFVHAVTPVPITLPAHATILTGDYPPTHGVRDNGSSRLIAAYDTLAERLKGAGYATAAFIGAVVLNNRYGLAQGFDVYKDEIVAYRDTVWGEDPYPQRPGDEVIDDALAWLQARHAANRDDPFFAWIHLFDPHSPYEPPEPYRTQYAGRPYDGEVAFTDAQVRRAVERLRELDLLDRTLIVVIGDHGEGLGDHGESTHALLIYGEAMRVPMILHAPAVLPQGQVVADRVVSLVDVAPTILDLLGLEPLGRDGVSLIRRSTSAGRIVYLETLHGNLNHGWAPLHGVRRLHDKYIQAPTPEYYDLVADPRERDNVVQRRGDESEELVARLAELMDGFAKIDRGGAARIEMTDEVTRQLAALGYVSDVEGATPSEGPLPDPKDVIARWERTTAAEGLVRQGRAPEALPRLQALLRERPDDAKLWSLLSNAYDQLQQTQPALQARERALQLKPEKINWWLHLASLQHRAGDAQRAGESLQKVQSLEPNNGGIHLVRAEQLLDRGAHDEALRQARAARELDPEHFAASSWALEGKIRAERGETDSARAAFKQAHELDRHSGAALLGLARLAERAGQFGRVVELAGRVRRVDTHWAATRAILARAHLELDQPEEALAAMRGLAEARPRDPVAHNNLGNVLYQLRRYDAGAAAYETAIALNPQYATAHHNLAMVRRKQGDLDVAIGHLREAVALNPRLTAARLELAEVLDLRKDRADAAEVLREGLERYPQDAELMCALAWRLATSPLEDLRDSAAAVALAERARTATSGEDPQALDTLAAAYARAGRFEEATALARQAAALAAAAGHADLAEAITERTRRYERRAAYTAP